MFAVVLCGACTDLAMPTMVIGLMFAAGLRIRSHIPLERSPVWRRLTRTLLRGVAVQLHTYVWKVWQSSESQNEADVLLSIWQTPIGTHTTRTE